MREDFSKAPGQKFHRKTRDCGTGDRVLYDEGNFAVREREREREREITNI